MSDSIEYLGIDRRACVRKIKEKRKKEGRSGIKEFR